MSKNTDEFKSTETSIEGLPHCPFCGYEKLIKVTHELDYTQAQCGDCSAVVEWRFWERRPFVVDVKSALAEATDHNQLASLIETALDKYKLR